MPVDYQDFSVDDFVMDDYFQKWVMHPDPATCTFWENYLSRNSQKRETVEKARKLLLSATFEVDTLQEQEVQHMWNAILEKAKAAKDPVVPAPAKQRENGNIFLWRNWRRIAAAVTGLILLAAAIWLLIPRNQSIVVQTAYGEVKEIRLPDNSTIILNGNTKITYAKQWPSDKPRKVYLDGEAFFKVTKAKPATGNARFIVHTAHLNVEVLGTEFNVSNRRYQTQVVLNSGKIQLDLKQTGKADQHLLMQPGELVAVSENQEKAIKKKVNPQKYASWISKKLILDNTSLSEVALMLEETYGIQVHFEDGRQSQQKLSGIIPTDNLDILLLTLSKAAKLDIEQSPQGVLFKNRNVNTRNP